MLEPITALSSSFLSIIQTSLSILNSHSMAWIGQVDEESRSKLAQNRLLSAAEEAAGIKKPFYRFNQPNPPKREGYIHRDGEKGIGYYRKDLKQKLTVEQATFVINCADGQLELTHAEAQMLKSMLLPAVALPCATVKQVISASLKTVEASRKEDGTKTEEVKQETHN